MNGFVDVTACINVLAAPSSKDSALSGEVVAIGSDRSIQLVDIRCRSVSMVMEANDVDALCFHHSTPTLFYGSNTRCCQVDLRRPSSATNSLPHWTMDDVVTHIHAPQHRMSNELIVCDDSGHVCEIDTQTRRVHSLHRHTSIAMSSTKTQSGSVVSGGFDATLRCTNSAKISSSWKISSSGVFNPPYIHSLCVWRNCIVAGCGDGVVRLFDYKDAKYPLAIARRFCLPSTHNSFVSKVVVGAGEDFIASTGNDGALLFHSTAQIRSHHLCTPISSNTTPIINTTSDTIGTTKYSMDGKIQDCVASVHHFNSLFLSTASSTLLYSVDVSRV